MSAPDYIWLQICGDCGCEDRSECQGEPPDHSETTWWQDNIFPSDVKYIRADKVVALEQEHDRVIALLRKRQERGHSQLCPSRGFTTEDGEVIEPEQLCTCGHDEAAAFLEVDGE